MDNKYFDDILRSKAEEEKIMLSASLNNKIITTINNLPERRGNKRIWKKYGLISAVLAFVFIIGIGFASPALAQDIPIISNVFEYLNSKNIVGDEYVKYSENVNQSKTDNGITLSIEDVVYDGVNLSIGYVVKSEKKTQDPFVNFDIKIDGMRRGISGRGSAYNNDEKSFAVVNNIMLDAEKIPNNFDVDLKVDEIDKVKGNWNFKIKVSTDKTKNKIIKVSPNKDLSSLEKDSVLKKITVTPLTTTLEVEGKTSIAESSVGWNFMIFDDKDKQISNVGISGSGYNNYSDEIYEYKGLQTKSDYITIVPYLMKSTFQKFMKVDLSDKFPLVISNKDQGGLIINKIEFLKDKTLIHFQLDKLFPQWTIGGTCINLEDENGYLHPLFPNNIKFSTEENCYIGEMEALPSKNKYKIVTKDIRDGIDIRDDLSFKVYLNK